MYVLTCVRLILWLRLLTCVCFLQLGTLGNLGNRFRAWKHDCEFQYVALYLFLCVFVPCLLASLSVTIAYPAHAAQFGVSDSQRRAAGNHWQTHAGRCIEGERTYKE